ncbi:MAG TPA: signal peptidase II [Ignavibacteria bacterium]|nr:signal peptidase II [Ignavibacteria bacterium]
MRVIILTVVLVIIDQISKLMIKGFSIPFLGISHKGMEYGNSFNVIDGIFKITFIENPGMAFGLEIIGKLGLCLFTVAATILIIYFIYLNRNESRYLRIALAFILGGAVGNLIDRTFYGMMYGYAPIFYGKVVDFFHVDIQNIRLFGKIINYPIFNVADIAVTVGFVMILLGYKVIFHKKAGTSPAETISINE